MQLTDTYEKLEILERLNEDLKDYNGDYKITKDLIEKNRELLLKAEQKIEEQSEITNQKLWDEFCEECTRDEDKAQLIDSRWLSDWSLECVFRAVDWELFTKLYSEDNIFTKKQMERDDEMKIKKEYDEIAFRKFGDLMYITTPKKKSKNFWMALA